MLNALHSNASWHDSVYWLLRGRLTSQAKLAIVIALLIAIAVYMPQLASQNATLAMIFGATLLMAAYMSASLFFTRRLCRTFGGATPHKFSHVVTPFTSMIDALNEQGVRLADIEKITVETGKFSNLLHYLNGDGKVLMGLTKENPDASVHVYGCNDLSSSRRDLRKELADIGAPQIKFHDTKKLALAHRNVIRTHDGRFFLWFEERHEMEQGHHYFPHGAFFFEITERTASLVESDVMNGKPFQPGMKYAA